MARWIVIQDMPVPPGVKDPLDGPYLLFTSNFDGNLATYMDELVERASPQLGEIYAHCIGCPQPAEGAALKAYIGRNQIDAGVVFAAYGAASVADDDSGDGLSGSPEPSGSGSSGDGSASLLPPLRPPRA